MKVYQSAVVHTISTKSRKQTHRSWNNAHQRYNYFEKLSKHLQAPHHPLYAINKRIIRASGGGSMIEVHYGANASLAVMTENPYHWWKIWHFQHSPRGFWQHLGKSFTQGDPVSEVVVREYMDDLTRELGIKDISEWQTVVQRQPWMHRLSNLGSLPVVLAKLYPNHNWNFSKSEATPLKQFNLPETQSKTYWRSAENRRKYLDFVRQQLGTQVESLYNLNTSIILQTRGIGILKPHKSSIASVVMVEYPEFAWRPWTLGYRGFWHHLQSLFSRNDIIAHTVVALIVEEIESTHNVESYEEWYKLPNFITSAIAERIDPTGNIAKILQKIYPNHRWEPNKISSANKRIAQRGLRKQMKKLFPKEEILEEVTPTALKFKFADELDAGALRFDFVLPGLSLVVEYHGGHHYHDVYIFGESKAQQYRDTLKREICKRNGFALVEIPYWWDPTDVETLKNEIRKQKPDLLPETTGSDQRQLSDTPSEDKRYPYELYRERLRQQFLMSKETNELPQDGYPWWAQERYEGVRVMWDGSRMFTDSGFPVYPPVDWRSALPATCLDGILHSDNGLPMVVDAINARYEIQ